MLIQYKLSKFSSSKYSGIILNVYFEQGIMLKGVIMFLSIPFRSLITVKRDKLIV